MTACSEISFYHSTKLAFYFILAHKPVFYILFSSTTMCAWICDIWRIEMAKLIEIFSLFLMQYWHLINCRLKRIFARFRNHYWEKNTLTCKYCRKIASVIFLTIFNLFYLYRVTHHPSQQSSPHTVWLPNMWQPKSGLSLEVTRQRLQDSPLVK